MTLQEVKNACNVETFKWSPSTDKNGKVDPAWYRMWDNENRIAYSIPTDAFAIIKANEQARAKKPSIAVLDNLGLQEAVVTPSEVVNGKVTAPYKTVRIILFTDTSVDEF